MVFYTTVNEFCMLMALSILLFIQFLPCLIVGTISRLGLFPYSKSMFHRPLCHAPLWIIIGNYRLSQWNRWYVGAGEKLKLKECWQRAQVYTRNRWRAGAQNQSGQAVRQAVRQLEPSPFPNAVFYFAQGICHHGKIFCFCVRMLSPWLQRHCILKLLEKYGINNERSI